ncbi:hypothetical protein AGC_0015 [Escherichia phage Eps7]|uniref:Uncharacterized protein n=2 Tax=Markadamsvirinae TaxID=2732013 RepID=B2I453_9CAUD|nr:hypothetical protein AGC_0015 [Escherichia phage Eps7]ACB97458.1 Hypothetical protein AGC_0015 [Escherichia phage Eps7]QXV80331.1 hypothetical protein bas32_0176 [Escherichia phage IrisVonRoten]
MSDKIVISKTSVTVDTFYVEDTKENRAICENQEYDKLIYDEYGYYTNLVDSYGESVEFSHQIPD